MTTGSMIMGGSWTTTAGPPIWVVLDGDLARAAAAATIAGECRARLPKLVHSDGTSFRNGGGGICWSLQDDPDEVVDESR